MGEILSASEAFKLQHNIFSCYSMTLRLHRIFWRTQISKLLAGLSFRCMHRLSFNDLKARIFCELPQKLFCFASKYQQMPTSTISNQTALGWIILKIFSLASDPNISLSNILVNMLPVKNLVFNNCENYSYTLIC